jgi:membrane protease YdiL (CAAX protease family)
VKRKVGLYLGVSFGIAWVCWGICWLIANRRLGGMGLTPFLIAGSFGPFIAAGLCVALDRGLGGMLRFYGAGFDPRMGLFVFIVAFFLVPCLAVLAGYIYHLQTGDGFALQMGWQDVPIAYLWLFVLGGPVAEEFGWSYLSDRLDEQVPVIAATVLLGVVWGFWHLPLFFLVVPGLLQHYMPFGLFVLFSVGLRFLFSWAYHKSGRRILSNLVFHNALNFALSLVVIVAPVAGDAHLRLWYLTGLAYAAAALLWWFAPPASLHQMA